MAAPYALLEAQALEQLAQIIKTDGRIGGAAEKTSKSFLSSHNDILHGGFAVSHSPAIVTTKPPGFLLDHTTRQLAATSARKPEVRI